jgi:hypothetical protein
MKLSTKIAQSALEQTRNVDVAMTLAEQLGAEVEGIDAKVILPPLWVKKRLRAGVVCAAWALEYCDDQELLIEVASKKSAREGVLEAVVGSRHLSDESRERLVPVLTQNGHKDFAKRLRSRLLDRKMSKGAVLAQLDEYEALPPINEVRGLFEHGTIDDEVYDYLVSLGRAQKEASLIGSVMACLILENKGAAQFDLSLVRAWKRQDASTWRELFDLLDLEGKSAACATLLGRVRGFGEGPLLSGEVAKEIVGRALPQRWPVRSSSRGRHSLSPEAIDIFIEAARDSDRWVNLLVGEEISDEQFYRLLAFCPEQATLLCGCATSAERADAVLEIVEAQYRRDGTGLSYEESMCLVATCSRTSARRIDRVYRVSDDGGRKKYFDRQWKLRGHVIRPKAALLIEDLKQGMDSPVSVQSIRHAGRGEIGQAVIEFVPGAGLTAMGFSETAPYVWERLTGATTNEIMALEMLCAQPDATLSAICETLARVDRVPG